MQAESAGTDRIRVLLAEDEAALRGDLSDLLELEGFDVRAAENGADALAAISAGWRPDVVLSDRMMPVMDGDALLDALRAGGPQYETAFVFMSALGTDAHRIDGLRGGADAYVAKPVAIGPLAEQLRALARKTGRMRAEAAAERERRGAAFLSIVPHELRTPLTPIIGYAEFLKMKEALPEDARAMAEMIEAGGRALLARIDDLLDLGAAIHRGLPVDRVWVDLNALAAEAEQRAQAAGHEAAIDISGCVGFVEADPDLLMRALSVLIENAVKYAAAAGPIRIEASTAAGETVLAVRDSGAGFGAAARAAALSLFDQADVAHTRRYGGQGLGLPLAQAICTAHGGRITIQDAPTGGAVVSLRLPGGGGRA